MVSCHEVTHGQVTLEWAGDYTHDRTKKRSEELRCVGCWWYELPNDTRLALSGGRRRPITAQLAAHNNIAPHQQHVIETCTTQAGRLVTATPQTTSLAHSCDVRQRQ